MPTSVKDGFTVRAGNADRQGYDEGEGGGLYTMAGYPTLINCAFVENAGYKHAGMSIWGGSVTLVNCLIAGNTASAEGGGVGIHAGDLTLTNCVLIGNTGSTGGAVMSVFASVRTVTLTNCTVVGNSAMYGGGLAVLGSGGLGTECFLDNCVFWGNTASTYGAQIMLHNSEAAVSYSDIEGGQPGVHLQGGATLIWGPGNIELDPVFVDPDGPDNDPDTWEDNDFHIDTGSPCIDAGDNTAVPLDTADLDNDGNTAERTPFDLDGYRRFHDDPNTVDSGVPDPPIYPEIVDMGAYELEPCVVDADCYDGNYCTSSFCDGAPNGRCPHTPIASRPYADVYVVADGDGAVEIMDTVCILDAANGMGDCVTDVGGYVIGDIWPCWPPEGMGPDGAVEIMDTLSVLDAASGWPGCSPWCP